MFVENKKKSLYSCCHVLFCCFFLRCFSKCLKNWTEKRRAVIETSAEEVERKQAKLNSKANQEWKTKQRFASTTCTDTSRFKANEGFAAISWSELVLSKSVFEENFRNIGKFVISALNDRIVICSSISSRSIINLSADWQTMNNPLSVKWHVSCLFSIFLFNFLFIYTRTFVFFSHNNFNHFFMLFFGFRR